MPVHDLSAIFSGSLVGLMLGLIGGGGSILAVPLLVYVVGVSSPHVAIGTSAVAVAVSALISLFAHVRQGNIKWRCASVFAVSGAVGAALGSTLGKQFDGERLMVLFGVLMVVVAGLMVVRRVSSGDINVRLTLLSAPKLMPLLLGYGVLVGMLAGFFGIGGGFLVVPGIIAATGMPLLFAIGSSLVSVSAFGFTTALNYALSGLVDWWLVGLFIGGGALGGILGGRLASTFSERKELLTQIFAGVVGVIGLGVIWQGLF